MMREVWTEFLFPTTPVPSQELGLRGGDRFSVSSADSLGAPLRRFMIMYCSFVDGFDRGIRFPLLYILKTEYLMSQAGAFIAFGVSMSPWLFKPFLAVVTDTVSLWGYRRKSYLISSAVVNGLSLWVMGACTMTHWGGFLLPMGFMTLRTFCRGLTGAVVQGMLLEESQLSDNAPVLVSSYHTAHRFGQMLSVGAAGYMLSTGSVVPIFLIMSGFHVGSIALAGIVSELEVREMDVTGWDDLPEKFDRVQSEAVPALSGLLEYSFLAMASPTYEARMSYYLLDAQTFSASDVALVTLAQTVAATVAPMVFSTFCADMELQPLLKYFTWGTFPASLLPLVITTGFAATHGLDARWIAIGSGFVLTVATDIQMLPVSVLVAQRAPKGLEGTSFSLFTLVEGMGRVFSNFSSGVIPTILGATAANQYRNMSLYVAVCAAMQLLPLPVVKSVQEQPPALEWEQGTVDEEKGGLDDEPPDRSLEVKHLAG